LTKISAISSTEVSGLTETTRFFMTSATVLAPEGAASKSASVRMPTTLVLSFSSTTGHRWFFGGQAGGQRPQWKLKGWQLPPSSSWHPSPS